jgi:C4-dicarboxylate-specific signal transduction histidine kinase
MSIPSLPISEDTFPASPKILVIDDELYIVQLLRTVFEDEGYTVFTATNAKDALKLIDSEEYDAAVLDIIIPNINGLDLIHKIKEKSKYCGIIVITGKPSIETAQRAIREGAFEYLTKPVDNEILVHITKKTIEQKKLLTDNENYARHLEQLVDQKAQQLEKSRTIMFHQDKLASIGQLASGIAHEISNPLSAIHMMIENLKQEQSDPNNIEQLDKINRYIDKVHSTLRNMITVARPSREKATLDNVNRIIVECVDLISYDPRAACVSINTNLSPQIPDILISVDRFRDVILNLIINALDALVEKEESKEVLIETCLENDHICIDIIDNGPGIAVDLQDKIFEIFFTTKETGKGSGIGLTICKQVIEALGGEITYKIKENAEGGAHFSIFLPIYANLEP